jgi:hypothetical protein
MKTKACPNPGSLMLSICFLITLSFINIESQYSAAHKPILYSLISFITLSLLILMFFSDPSLKNNSDLSPLLKSPYKKLANLYSNRPAMNSVSIKVPFRFCETCKMSTYEDTEHCTQCGLCVSGFQNHCVFLSNCIGNSNKILFYIFLISLHCWNLFNIKTVSSNLMESYFQGLVLLPTVLIFQGYLTAISLLKCFL